MIKHFLILTLKPNIDEEKAYSIWRDKNAIWMQQQLMPELKKMTINKVIKKYPGAGGRGGDFNIFGYTLCWFDDYDSAIKAVERLHKVAPDDFLSAYVDTYISVIMQTRQIDLGE
jgi:hypothetical protein